ncbi:MAG: DUF1854 domain-containing protein [Defluviitaleaceae bacterium]|nr:DUF1854 domain-containing protein [Defluviitaleaceae bacterium]
MDETQYIEAELAETVQPGMAGEPLAEAETAGALLIKETAALEAEEEERGEETGKNEANAGKKSAKNAENDPASAETDTGLAGAVDIGWLDLAKAEFYAGAGGFTGLRYGGKDYKRVQLRRSMPVQYPSEFISVADHENKEIGLIRKLTDLSDGQLAIVSDELARRYYCPEIISVKSVRDKLGYVYIEMAVSAGGGAHERSAAVNDVNKNIRLLDANRLIIFDVDGNRYIVNAIDKLDKKSLQRLEPYMF